MQDEEQEPIPMAELQEHWQQQDGDQQTQLTRLHQVKADAQTLVRPMRAMTVETDGLPAVQTARKAVVKMRTSVDKRRKALNDEAQTWIKTVNGVAKEITGILEPVEEHLKNQEALEADRHAGPRKRNRPSGRQCVAWAGRQSWGRFLSCRHGQSRRASGRHW